MRNWNKQQLRTLPNLEGLKTKTLQISRSMDTYRTADFEANFHFKETVKADLCCPICKDILDMPLESHANTTFALLAFLELSRQPNWLHALCAKQISMTCKLNQQ